MVVLRLDGSLFFATSDALEDRIHGNVHRAVEAQLLAADTPAPEPEPGKKLNPP